MKNKCLTKHSKKKFTLKETRSAVYFENPKAYNIEETKIDNCEITSGPRCDYLVNISQCNQSVLVELKGRDVLYAIEQLKSTHTRTISELKNNVFWLVSSSRCPLASTEIQALSIKILNKFKARLIVKNSPVTYKLP